MRIMAGTLWVWLLGYVIHTVTGAVLSPRGSQATDPRALPSLNKILGGHECRAHSRPWMAAVFFQDAIICGGALVHPQWVVTAAHCFGSSYTIGLGLHSRDPHQEPNTQMVESTISVRHPLYDDAHTGHDLMLIKLSKPAVESDTVKPISIASQSATPKTQCLFSGWGQVADGAYPIYLQCMDVKVLSGRRCISLYPWMQLYRMFCAKTVVWSSAACDGDSGGPLICNGVLQGLYVGTRDGCEHRVFPDLYIDLFNYKDWIQEIIRTH